ncbi:MAG: hypothetical protein ACKVHE_36050, partial [Planctomycetales bacterium]
DAVRVPPNSTDGVELTNEYEEVGVSDLQEDQQEVRVVSEATAGPEKIAAQELVAPESKPETSRVLLTDYVETTTTDDRGKAKSRQLNEASKAEKARLEKVYDEKAMRRAGSCIAMTKQLIQTGKAGEPQAKWMREVVADFPDSELATQAAVLLEQIPQ